MIEFRIAIVLGVGWGTTREERYKTQAECWVREIASQKAVTSAGPVPLEGKIFEGKTAEKDAYEWMCRDYVQGAIVFPSRDARSAAQAMLTRLKKSKLHEYIRVVIITDFPPYDEVATLDKSWIESIGWNNLV